MWLIPGLFRAGNSFSLFVPHQFLFQSVGCTLILVPICSFCTGTGSNVFLSSQALIQSVGSTQVLVPMCSFPHRHWFQSVGSVLVLVSICLFDAGTASNLFVPCRYWFQSICSTMVLLPVCPSLTGTGSNVYLSMLLLVPIHSFHAGTAPNLFCLFRASTSSNLY